MNLSQYTTEDLQTELHRRMECTELTNVANPCQCDYCVAKREFSASVEDEVVISTSESVLQYAVDMARADVAYALNQCERAAESGDIAIIRQCLSFAIPAQERALQHLTTTAAMAGEWTPQEILDREG